MIAEENEPKAIDKASLAHWFYDTFQYAPIAKWS